MAANDEQDELKKRIKEIKDEVKKNTVTLSQWELEFIDSVSVQAERYGMSVKQAKIINRIYDTYLGYGGETKKANEEKDSYDHYTDYSRR